MVYDISDVQVEQNVQLLSILPLEEQLRLINESSRILIAV